MININKKYAVKNQQKLFKTVRVISEINDINNILSSAHINSENLTKESQNRIKQSAKFLLKNIIGPHVHSNKIIYSGIH